MKIPFNDLYTQYQSIKKDIDQAISSVITDSAFIRGQYVDEFEKSFAKEIGVENCVSCANGTDALYIAIKCLELQQGDEVITTAHSWISTSQTITQAGGKVVFVDTDETFTINPNQIEEKITPKTVGIIPVHLFGQPADMGRILEIAKKYGLWVIEDCAQAHLAEYENRRVGTIGDIATFSFYPGKNLGAMGDAGCLVTNDSALANWCKLYARHGGKGEHLIEGINSRMDGLQAAILSVKLPYLQDWTRRRQRIASLYIQELNNIEEIMLPTIAEERTHVYHLFVIRTTKRDELYQHLSEGGISTSVNYPKALPFNPAYSYLKHTHADFPNAFKNQKEILSLPIYPEITDEMLEYVFRQIHSFFK